MQCDCAQVLNAASDPELHAMAGGSGGRIELLPVQWRKGLNLGVRLHPHRTSCCVFGSVRACSTCVCVAAWAVRGRCWWLPVGGSLIAVVYHSCICAFVRTYIQLYSVHVVRVCVAVRAVCGSVGCAWLVLLLFLAWSRFTSRLSTTKSSWPTQSVETIY